MDMMANLPVAIIGAGPVDLAAAAHLVERGIRPVVFERGESVGAALLEWGHVRVFSPWEYNVDVASRSSWDRAPREGSHIPKTASGRRGSREVAPSNRITRVVRVSMCL